MASRMTTETYLNPENSFLRLIKSMSVANPNINPDLTTHILGSYSSNAPVYASRIGKGINSLMSDSMNPQATN